MLRQWTERVRELRDRTLAEVGRVVVGMEDVTHQFLIALLAGGHVLLEGVPGVAKTTLSKTFARVLGIQYQRIQFTPDLLPSDVTGTYIFDRKTNDFVLRKGPIFCQVLLADEVNRAPAKTQSALLEAMQENQVTIEGTTLPLPQPFMVLATQNPVEQEGVYRLPEAQLDRFLLRVEMGYPGAGREVEMLQAAQPARSAEVEPLFNAEDDPATCRGSCPRSTARRRCCEYIVDLAEASRAAPRRARWGPARGRRCACCAAPAPAPCSTAGTTSPTRTCRRSPGRARPPADHPARGRGRGQAAADIIQEILKTVPVR